MATHVEDLLVYQKSLLAMKAISALIKTSAIRSDWKLRAQLLDAAISVPSNTSEGFNQQTDRLFAKYLYAGRGSAYEVRTHLTAAFTLEYISYAELLSHEAMYEEIARMLTGLIKYLQASEGAGRRAQRPASDRAGTDD
jgi:four helix bundle protein